MTPRRGSAGGSPQRVPGPADGFRRRSWPSRRNRVGGARLHRRPGHPAARANFELRVGRRVRWLPTQSLAAIRPRRPVEEAVRDFRATRPHEQVFQARGRRVGSDVNSQEAAITIRSALETINPRLAKKLPANVLGRDDDDLTVRAPSTFLFRNVRAGSKDLYLPCVPDRSSRCCAWRWCTPRERVCGAIRHRRSHARGGGAGSCWKSASPLRPSRRSRATTDPLRRRRGCRIHRRARRPADRPPASCSSCSASPLALAARFTTVGDPPPQPRRPWGPGRGIAEKRAQPPGGAFGRRGWR